MKGSDGGYKLSELSGRGGSTDAVVNVRCQKDFHALSKKLDTDIIKYQYQVSYSVRQLLLQSATAHLSIKCDGPLLERATSLLL